MKGEGATRGQDTPPYGYRQGRSNPSQNSRHIFHKKLPQEIVLCAYKSKRGDLRAFGRLVEGLYPLEGEGRFTGVSEGFMGKWCLYPTEGFCPLMRACAQKICGKFFRGSFL